MDEQRERAAFHNSPFINPSTGRAIGPKSPIYQKLLKRHGPPPLKVPELPSRVAEIDSEMNVAFYHEVVSLMEKLHTHPLPPPYLSHVNYREEIRQLIPTPSLPSQVSVSEFEALALQYDGRDITNSRSFFRFYNNGVITYRLDCFGPEKPLTSPLKSTSDMTSPLKSTSEPLKSNSTINFRGSRYVDVTFAYAEELLGLMRQLTDR